MPTTHPGTASRAPYEADIRWGTHGVAHIRAESWGDLGFGQGWACARDNLGTILDMVVKVRSERARFHGPGLEDRHLASDFGYLALGIRERAARLRDAQPSYIREVVTGYVHGCNTWLEEARRTDRLPAWCASAAWLRPIDELDLYSYLVDATLLASGRNLVGVIGRAEAPGPDGPIPPSPLSALGPTAGASNGWAFGGDVSASGGGLVMANPHFPWYGEARFWECHLTLPGELDVYGVSLIGIPGVQIGFNRGLAWTHTFSTGNRFTLYRLDLAPGDPTSYCFGSEQRSMTPTELTVAVRTRDDRTEPCSRTLWSSHHGPMVNLPLVGWGTEQAFTYRDANLDNTAMLELFMRMDRATDLDAFQAAFAATQGMPWANTLAADASGRAWYVDASATPKLSAGTEKRLRERLATDPFTALLYQNRVALLDGSEPDDTWVEVPGARSPGLVPYDECPQLERRDSLLNANDSHWLTNAAEPLTGFSALHGLERTPRSPRTRQNLRQVARLVAAGGLTPEKLLGAVLDGSGLGASLLRDELVARLDQARAAEGGLSGPDAARLSHAAEVFAGWDGTCRLGSRGAVLWRELLAGFADADLRDAGPLFAVPFDPDHPVDTPTGLASAASGVATGSDAVVAATLAALDALDAAGIDPAAALDEAQWAAFDGVRVPLPGGCELEGVANVVVPTGGLPSQSLAPVPPSAAPVPGRFERTGLAHGGYRIAYGTSFLMAVELTPGGPRGLGLTVYGQQEEATTANRECAEAFAAGAWRPLRFTDDDIEADPNLTQRTIQG